MSVKIRNKKRRLAGSTDIPDESTVNKISHTRTLRSSGELLTFPSRAVITPDQLTLTSSEALSSEMDSPLEVSYSVNTGKKKKSNVAERADNDSSKIINSHRPSYAQLLDAINSETSREAMALLLSENSITQEGLNQSVISACRRGHKLLVQTLVSVGANIEHRDEHGNTPLLICAENGFTDIVRFLVSRHANVNAVHYVGNTALILSVRSAGSIDLTRFLLEQQDIDIHHENQHGHTALLRATHFMDVDAMRLLLEKSMKRKTVQRYGEASVIRPEKDFSFYDSRSQEIIQQVTAKITGLIAVHRILQDHLTTRTSPLELAIKAADTKSLDIFLDCQFSSMEEKKGFIDSALIYMLENHQRRSEERCNSIDIRIIQKLLQYGAEVNLDYGPRLISVAVELGNLQLVESLCVRCADMKKDYSGEQDPIYIAAKNDRRDIIELLFKYNADASTSYCYNKDSEGNTALFHAVRWQNGKNVTCLINYAKDKKSLINVQNNVGLTPLIVSVQKGNVLIMRELIEKGAHVNMRDNKENTALHHLLITCPRNREEILTSLLEAGSHVNCQNSCGLSPLMLATKKTMVSMISQLLDAGADVNAVSKKNTSATALSFLPDIKFYINNAVSCIETLMNKGACCSYLKPEFFHKLIIKNKLNIIPKLIQHGLGPVDVETNRTDLRNSMSGLQSAMSPFLVALLHGQVHLARYFVDILFLTSSDLSVLRSNKAVVRLLKQKGLDESLKFFPELSSQPMPLVKLCLVTVSAAVGSFLRREARVDSLPLPQMMKELLFKSVSVKEAALAEMPSKFNPMTETASYWRVRIKRQADCSDFSDDSYDSDYGCD